VPRDAGWTGRPQYLLYGLLCGYGFAWVGHFVFEKNKPASFKRPLWSFMGDWRMYQDIWTRRDPVLTRESGADVRQRSSARAPAVAHRAAGRCHRPADRALGHAIASSSATSPTSGWAERPREALLGRTLQELYGDEAWQRAAPAFAAAFEGRTVHYDRRLTHGSHGAHWARVQVFPDVDPHGKVEAVFTIAFDIHEDVPGARGAGGHARAPGTASPRTSPTRSPTSTGASCCASSTRRTARSRAAGLRTCWAATSARCACRALGRACPFFERALKGQTVQYTRLVDRRPHGPRWLRTSYVPDGRSQDAIGRQEGYIGNTAHLGGKTEHN
jgi:hypothetical protein